MSSATSQTALTTTAAPSGLNVTVIAIVASAVIVTLISFVFVVICCSEAITKCCDKRRKIAIEKKQEAVAGKIQDLAAEAQIIAQEEELKFLEQNPMLAPEAMMGEAYDPNNLIQSYTPSTARMSRQQLAGGGGGGGGRATPSGMFGARQSVVRQPFGGGMQQRSPSMAQWQSPMGNMGMQQQQMGGGMYNTQPQGMVGAQMQNEQAMQGGCAGMGGMGGHAYTGLGALPPTPQAGAEYYSYYDVAGDQGQQMQQQQSQQMMMPQTPARQAMRPVSKGPALAPIEAGTYGDYGAQYYNY